MFLGGAPDSRWNNNDLHQLGTVTAANFEVVQMPAVITSTNVPQGVAPTITGFTLGPAPPTANG